MRAEPPRLRRVAFLLAAALFATGCATLPASPSRGDTAGHGPHAAPALRQQAGGAAPAQASPEGAPERSETRLYRRHGERRWATDVALVSPEEEAQREAARAERAPQAPPSCGGRAVPEGWPDYSAWWDEELLAPFFQCTSPAEFLALQRRVDMPRLVEALDDWNAVRLGALGPMEGPAARVLQRKRFSFLVNAPRLYGAYAQVLTLFLFDTAFDDEVRELLVLLAKDKQLKQTLGPMEAVGEALEQRGFNLSDYPERDEQLRDVVRGLGRAADDVASTISLADGPRGGDVFAKRADLPPPYQEAFDETERALTREHWAPGHVALGAFDSMTFGVPLGFYSLVAGTGHGVYTLAQGQYEQATRELTPAALMVGLYAGGKGVRYLSEARGSGRRGDRSAAPGAGVAPEGAQGSGGAAAGAAGRGGPRAVGALPPGRSRGGRPGGRRGRAGRRGHCRGSWRPDPGAGGVVPCQARAPRPCPGHGRCRQEPRQRSLGGGGGSGPHAEEGWSWESSG